MLNIQTVAHLARLLETTPRRLIEVADSASSYYEELILIDPARPDKVRDILNVIGCLRRLQGLLHDKVLVPARRPSMYSHGGIRGRNIKSNATPHLGSTFLYTTDIADFYPSVHYSKVYKLFTNDFSCSADVGRICTKLCTHQFHMPLGLITSPILADCLMKPADRRIGRMCEQHELVFSRYVDDIGISGRYPVDSGSYPRLVTRILGEYGFSTNPNKEDKGRLSEEKHITKLRVRRERLNVSREYLAEIRAQLESAALLSQGGDSTGAYYAPCQIYGRIRFIAWVNPGRRHELMRKYRSINWKSVEAEAKARGLVQVRKRLVRKSQFESDEGRGSSSHKLATL